MKKFLSFLKALYHHPDLLKRQSFRFGVFSGVCLLFFVSIPIEKKLASQNNEAPTSTIFSKDGTPISILQFNPEGNNIPVLCLDSAELYLFRYLLLREDDHFMEQRNILSKFWRNFYGISYRNFILFKKGGGSTLDQQLLKNLSQNFQYILNGHERNFNSKLGEISGAFKLSQAFTPKEILQMYLNQVYFLKANNQGVLMEALNTFEVSDIKELNELECYLVARSVKGVYCGGLDYRSIKRISTDSLKTLLKQSFTTALIDQGKATQEDLDRLLSLPVRFRKKPVNFNNTYVNNIAKPFTKDSSKSQQFLTTLDTKTIDVINTAVAEYAKANKKDLSDDGYILDGNVVAVDLESGNIIGINTRPIYMPKGKLGVKNKLNDKFPIASTIKPLLIALGVEAGLLNRNTQLADVHKKRLKNAHDKYKGMISLKDVLKFSSNVALDNFKDKDSLIRLLEKTLQAYFGKEIRPLPKNFGMSNYVIGEPRELSIVQLTAMYTAVFRGMYRDNGIIHRVMSTDAFPYDTSYYRGITARKFLSPATVGIIKWAMTGFYEDGGTIYKVAKTIGINNLLYGKTGTSEDATHGWTVAANDKHLVIAHVYYSKFNSRTNRKVKIPTHSGAGSAGVIAINKLKNL
jgi:membrane peptidoglycan carboxypeptidase